MAWGPLSTGRVLEEISFRQSGRFYFWRSQKPPVPVNIISSNTANMHMIPADSRIEKKLKSIRANQIIEFEGYLIRADKPDGSNWVSSLTRNDTGAGACEVIWVEKLFKIKS